MTWYTFLLFLHIALAIVWIGGGLMMQFFGIRAMLAGPDRLAAFGADAGAIAFALAVAAAAVALIAWRSSARAPARTEVQTASPDN